MDFQVVQSVMQEAILIIVKYFYQQLIRITAKMPIFKNNKIYRTKILIQTLSLVQFQLPMTDNQSTISNFFNLKSVPKNHHYAVYITLNQPLDSPEIKIYSNISSKKLITTHSQVYDNIQFPNPTPKIMNPIQADSLLSPTQQTNLFSFILELCTKEFNSAHNQAQIDSKYEGQQVNGLRDGKGECTFVNGDKYIGEFKDGKLHGKGVKVYSDGDQYQGDWQNNKKSGQGVYTWADGTKYKGEFKMNKKNGWGTFTWPNGNKYQGFWKQNKRCGNGMLQCSNGQLYHGEWQDDKPNGRGIYSWSQNSRYQGQWQNGRMHGVGLKIQEDGSKFLGSWVNNKKHGKGIQTSFDGDKYEGSWVNGIKHGYGEYHSTTGVKLHQNWQNGIKLEEVQLK